MSPTNQNLMGVISIKKHLLNPLSMFLLGLCLGVVSRLFDIYTEILGNIFSQLQIWILLGTLIAIYSPTKKQAMLNIFPFCLGMLITYYATAIITHGIYGRSFIIGWTIFAFCSPVFAYFAWMTKDKGWFPKVISIGIVAVSVYTGAFLFEGFRFYDFIIDALLIYFLFFKRIVRE